MENISRYADYARELTRICRERGFRLRTIGHVGPDRFPLFFLMISGRRNAKVVCLTAGIHGDERSGPHAMLAFLKTYRPKRSDPTLVIFPSLNPFGFDRNRRRTSERRDPNRHWTDRAAHVPMHAMVKRLLRGQRIDHFLSLHEDLRTKYFLYVLDRTHTPYYRALLDAGRSIVPVHGGNMVYKARSEEGLVIDLYDRSMEDWMHAHGAKTVACAEAPGRLPLDVRVKLNLAVIHAVIRLARTTI